MVLIVFHHLLHVDAHECVNDRILILLDKHTNKLSTRAYKWKRSLSKNT
jgi:hypothetical protein